MSVELDLSQGDLTPQELLKALDRLPDALNGQLGQAARDIGERIAGDARENAPSDTGQLGSSNESVVSAVGGTLVEVHVGTNLEYAAPQEFGADPFFPPPSALRDWARRVLGDADAAYPVARSISETGIEEKRFLRDAFENNIQWAADRINDAVEAALREVGLK